MTSMSHLKKIAAVPIHFVRAEEIKDELDSLGGMIAAGSVANVRSDKDLFEVVASAMQFPEYFGSNWDALDECLGVDSADGVRYVREIDVGRAIGTDKFSGGQSTSIMTAMTDKFGNLVTAFPGVLK